MILRYVLWTFSFMQLSCLTIPMGYSERYTDTSYYEVDVRLDEDLQLENKDRFRVSDGVDRENDFLQLKRLAIKENSKSKKPIYWFKLKDITITKDTQMTKLVTTTEQPTRATPKEIRTSKKRNKKQDTTVYDYDQFLHEYYDDMLYMDRENDTYHPKPENHSLLDTVKSLVSGDRTDPRGEKLLGDRVVKNLYHDLGNRNCSVPEFLGRLWRVVRVWLLIYLAVAIPFWCTKGWSCCWLCCKLCKPQVTIEEAKTYYVLNPPGILMENNGHTLYEPSEKERECYLEFEHLMKII